MLKGLLNSIEALTKATSYSLILITGFTATALGAFIVVMLAYRIGQFLWLLIFKEPWI